MNRNGFVKIIRFDNKGFHCKPYTSPDFRHIFEFIDYEIKDLFNVNQSFQGSELIKPTLNDTRWSGCFCFLDEYDESLFELALRFRSHDKMHMALIPTDTIIWVRNVSPLGISEPFFSNFIEPVQHEGGEYWFSESSDHFDGYKWVKMTVELALERTRLWKEKFGYVPERITEFYLMQGQLKLLSPVSFKDRCRVYFYNIKRR